MKLRNLIISILVIALLVGAGWAYWYFMMGPKETITATPTSNDPQRFNPINRNNNTSTSTRTGSGGNTNQPVTPTESKIVTLRLLSDTPVGGYGAVTPKSTTTVRWVDRGRGNIYEATYESPAIITLSNTVVPRVMQSVWNKNLTAFIGSIFESDGEELSTVYAQLIKQTNSTSTSILTSTSQVAPFELRGKNIVGNLVGYAASPDKSRVFMFMEENGMGVGYTASFDGKNMVKIFTTPMVQVNIDWPTDSIITVTTKGSAYDAGYMYFVNSKTGKMTKVLGPMNGLSAVASRDGKYVAYSAVVGNQILTSIMNVSTKAVSEAVIRTLADKCTWGNASKEILYCGVPSETPGGTYPDDWYKGTISSVDKIWQVNASTGDAKLVSNIIDTADRTINAFNLSTDPKDNYLFFMNKNDLSLWSLDLKSN